MVPEIKDQKKQILGNCSQHIPDNNMKILRPVRKISYIFEEKYLNVELRFQGTLKQHIFWWLNTFTFQEISLFSQK